MQMEITLNLLSCTLVNVDGKNYCSIHSGQRPVGPATETTLGLEVTKIGAEPEVFHQLKARDFAPGDYVKFVAILRKAAQGKSQPHIIGVVPEQHKTPTEPHKKAS